MTRTLRLNRVKHTRTFVEDGSVIVKLHASVSTQQQFVLWQYFLPVCMPVVVVTPAYCVLRTRAIGGVHARGTLRVARKQSRMHKRETTR